jgi:ornithine cyclodeaminase/alanine dehydrogenase-like protein (mu-crystallin family)
MSLPPLWISEADVASLMTLPEAIDALERGLLAEARGEAQNMLKTHVAWGGGHTLHAIGAAFPTLGFVGTKTWAHTGGGASPLLILFDSHIGALQAIIEAFALGQMRTGGISGVATRWLAAADADELAIIGTGKQALSQVAAVAAVRALKRVRVFSPNPAHRAAFVEDLRSAFTFEVTDAASVAAAVDGAPIITLVTRATTPVLSAAMVSCGSHINAVGAITPDRVEFATDIFPRCSRVVVDSLPSVQKLSRELIDFYGSGRGDWGAVAPLCEVVAARQPRPARADITLFKAMGMGISDLSLGIEVYDRAMRQGAGRRLDAPQTR